MKSHDERIAELEQTVIELKQQMDKQAEGFLEFVTKHETSMNQVISHYRKQLEMALNNATKQP